jgi:hypothetical protein
MINGIGILESKELRDDINNLYDKVFNTISLQNLHYGLGRGILSPTKNLIDRILYNHVLGVDAPICICDGHSQFVGNDFYITIMVDYKVTSGYKPYQNLETPLKFKFIVNLETIRDHKIDRILC